LTQKNFAYNTQAGKYPESSARLLTSDDVNNLLKDELRLMRNEIYAVGDSRDINVSIEKFLGRPRSLEPFLKKIGVNQ